MKGRRQFIPVIILAPLLDHALAVSAFLLIPK